MFNSGEISSKYKKFKFLIMTMLKYEINKQNFPKFNSKDIDGYCNEIIAYANNEEEFSKS